MSKREESLQRVSHKLKALHNDRLDDAKRNVEIRMGKEPTRVSLAFGIFLSLLPLPFALLAVASHAFVKAVMFQANWLFVLAILALIANVFTRRSFPARHFVTIAGSLAFSCAVFLPALALRGMGPLAAGFLLYGLSLLITTVYAGAVYIIGTAVAPVLARVSAA